MRREQKKKRERDTANSQSTKNGMPFLNGLNILAHEWARTPADVIANCFWLQGFVQLNSCAEKLPIETADATATTEDDVCFVLPPAMLLDNYISINDHVTMARQLTKEGIESHFRHKG